MKKTPKPKTKPIALNKERLAERIAGREAAKRFLDQLPRASLAEPERDQFRIAFWDEFDTTTKDLRQAEFAGPVAMTDAQVQQFQKDLMPFGRYRDVPIGDVPLAYLDWLAGENPKVMNENIVRYLKNPTIAAALKKALESGNDDA